MFTDDLNEALRDIQTDVADLFMHSKTQIQSLEAKSNSSFTELSNIYRRDTTYQDTFVDSSKISTTDKLVYDKNGWSNAFQISEVRFLESYYTSTSYNLDEDSVKGRSLVPGSVFSDIFSEQNGFWGFLAPTAGLMNVTLYFQERLADLNRIYLRTNAVVTVEALYLDSAGAWVSLGERTGQHHIWARPIQAQAIKFSTVASVFTISYVAAGLATYVTQGTLTTTTYAVEKLDKLSIVTTADVPPNTAIETYVGLGTTPNFQLWENGQAILGATEEYIGTIPSGYVIPSGYIEDSLWIRDGYQEWDVVNTDDYRLVIEACAIDASGFVVFPYDYQVFNHGVQGIRIGDHTFTRGLDYTDSYDLTNNWIRIDFIQNDTLTEGGSAPVVDVVLKRPFAVAQRRTYITAEQETSVVLYVPATNTSLQARIVKIILPGETREERLVSPPAGANYIFTIQPGTTLIELTDYDPADPPLLSGSYVFFANRFRLVESTTGTVEDGQYILTPVADGWRVDAINTDLYARYLTPTTDNQVTVRFALLGTQNVSPHLNGYEIVSES